MPRPVLGGSARAGGPGNTARAGGPGNNARAGGPAKLTITEATIERVLRLEAFRVIDPRHFPETASLRDLIRQEVAVHHYRRGDIIVRKGDYGHSVFGVLVGSARVVMTPEGEDLLAATYEPQRPHWGRALLRLLRRIPPYPESHERYERVETAEGPARSHLRVRGLGADERTQAYIDDFDTFLGEVHTELLPAGHLFGEIAALARTPRTATVVASTESVVAELTGQGLREIRRRDPSFRAYVDGLYRAHSVRTHLAESSLFHHLDDGVLEEMAAVTLFETYGQFDWTRLFKGLTQSDSVIDHEPIVAEEGGYADGLIIIRSGFARMSRRRGDGEQTMRYLAKNEVFGLEEILQRWRTGVETPLRHSLRAVGYVDILRLPTALVERYLLPNLPRTALNELTLNDLLTGNSAGSDAHSLPEVLLDFLVNSRAINGTAIMFVDLDRCTGCDDCVRACAANHGGNPRFLRDGPDNSRLLLVKACMHCYDPVCLIGCPTGAIHRQSHDGWVVIDPNGCVGCGACAQSCPYDNVRMVEIRDRRGQFVLDPASGQPMRKATKCDMCHESPGGPACQRVCTRGALIRLSMRNLNELIQWLGG